MAGCPICWAGNVTGRVRRVVRVPIIYISVVWCVCVCGVYRHHDVPSCTPLSGGGGGQDCNDNDTKIIVIITVLYYYGVIHGISGAYIERREPSSSYMHTTRARRTNYCTHTMILLVGHRPIATKGLLSYYSYYCNNDSTHCCYCDEEG